MMRLSRTGASSNGVIMSSITPPQPGAGPIPGIVDLIRGLDQVSVTADKITDFVVTVVGIWKSFTKQEVSLTEIAALIENVLRENKEFGEIEILRLKAQIAERLIVEPPPVMPSA
jgi:hypothetical protein